MAVAKAKVCPFTHVNLTMVDEVEVEVEVVEVEVVLKPPRRYSGKKHSLSIISTELYKADERLLSKVKVPPSRTQQ